jgi:hypothetical protein
VRCGPRGGCNLVVELVLRLVIEGKFFLPRGSSGGSTCTIQSTLGMSNPLAATSVHIRVPAVALENSKKVFVRFLIVVSAMSNRVKLELLRITYCCFIFPCKASTGNYGESASKCTTPPIKTTHIYVVKQFGVVCHYITTTEEADNLLFQVYIWSVR